MQLNSIRNCKKKKTLLVAKNRGLQLNKAKILIVSEIVKKKKLLVAKNRGLQLNQAKKYFECKIYNKLLLSDSSFSLDYRL
jgi:hypothetical protein